MTTKKPVELDYLPTRNGGEDQIHTHLSFRPTAEQRESCGACAQLANDFAWLRFNDGVADHRDEFGTVEEAMEYARENVTDRRGGRAEYVSARAVA